MSRAEWEKSILESISADQDLRKRIEAVPDRVAATVASFVPVDTGTLKSSIEVKARRSPWKRLSFRRIKVGEVYSDDDPAKVNTIEYGRGETDDNGPTPAFKPFLKAAIAWDSTDV